MNFQVQIWMQIKNPLQFLHRNGFLLRPSYRDHRGRPVAECNSNDLLLQQKSPTYLLSFNEPPIGIEPMTY